MTARARHLLAAFVLLATGVLLGWIGRGRSGADPANDPAVSPALRLRDRMVAQIDFDPSKLERFTAAEYADYLERHGRSADSLLAVFQLTKDESILREAYERFDDPAIAVHAFHFLELTKEEKQALAKQLEQTHVESPLGPVLNGALLAKDGQSAAAIAKLREAASKGSMDSGIPNQLLAQREALMNLGKTSLEARLLTTFFVDMPYIEPYHALARHALAEVKSLIAADNTDAAIALARDVITYARNLSAGDNRFVVHEMVAVSLEAGALDALPPDVEIGDSGLTAAEQAARLRKEVKFDMVAMNQHVSRLDEAGLETYLQVLESQGDRAALRWAERYNGPTPNSPDPQQEPRR